MEKRLQEAQVYKEEGNQRYREGKYRDAVSRYHRALLQLRGLDPSLPSPLSSLGPQGPALTPEQENILHTIQTHCYNNLADANVRRYLQLTQSELSSYHRKEKQLYLGMFG
uniref:Tetratricopeptide repeat domain 9C n=1 Tax=Mus musculus TaxID=10090 RepID=Q6P3Y6_MOUSE|nr:Ttc9c protein [Mus musculus]